MAPNRTVEVGVDKPHINLTLGSYWCVQLVMLRGRHKFRVGNGATIRKAWAQFELLPSYYNPSQMVST